MRTFYWKAAFVVLTGLLIEWLGYGSSAVFLGLALLSIPLSLLLAALCGWLPCIRSVLPARPLALLLFPLLFLALHAGTKREEGLPPQLWFHFSSENPDYDHRILARARVQEAINPGLYLARIRMLSYQRDLDPSFHGKKWINVHPPIPVIPAGGPISAARNQPADPAGFAADLLEILFPGLSHQQRKRRKEVMQEGQGSAQRVPGREPIRQDRHNLSGILPFLSALKIDSRKLHPGCEIRLQVFGRGVPERPYGGFGQYLKERGAESYLRVYRKWHVLDIHCPRDLRADLRDRLFEILERELSETSNQVGRAILLGESGWMDREVRGKAKRLGIMHLFAASGLHLGIFYGVFFLPLSMKWGRKHPAALFLPLIPCGFYVWALYFPVSLCRAFVFILLIALASLLHRRRDVYHHLANTAIILLLWDPMAFFSLSGYLSFGAVTGILLFYRRIEESLFAASHWSLRFLRSQMALSLSASLFITPLLVWTFHEHPFTGHLSNILLVPFTGIMLPPVYILVALQLLVGSHGPGILDWLWSVASNLIEWFVALTTTLSQYSLFFRYSGGWNFAFLLSLLTILLVLASRKGSRGNGLLMKSAFLLMLAGGLLSLVLVKTDLAVEFFGEPHAVAEEYAHSP